MVYSLVLVLLFLHGSTADIESSPIGSVEGFRDPLLSTDKFESDGVFQPLLDNSVLQWTNYKQEFDKFYGESESQHLENFVRNSILIEEHNKRFREGKETFEMGQNNMTDWSPSEYEHLNGYRHSVEGQNNTTIILPSLEQLNKLPTSVDYRWAMPWVKNQGQCGSCYAFAATGAIEAQHTFTKKQKIRFSEQNIIDCSHEAPNSGCKGGNINVVFKFVGQNGINPESRYHYEARVGKCRSVRSARLFLHKIMAVRQGDERSLQYAVATGGAVAVAIDASRRSFMNYRRGIYYDKGCRRGVSNRAVLVVGYGNEGGHDYWLIKNSWGTGWGEGGYMKLYRGSNHCGVADHASFPKL